MFGKRGFLQGILFGGLMGAALYSALRFQDSRQVVEPMRRITGQTIRLQAGAKRAAQRVSNGVNEWFKR